MLGVGLVWEHREGQRSEASLRRMHGRRSTKWKYPGLIYQETVLFLANIMHRREEAITNMIDDLTGKAPLCNKPCPPLPEKEEGDYVHVCDPSLCTSPAGSACRYE